MYKQGKYPIVSKKTLAKGIFDIEIYCPHIAKAAKAGQFAQVQAEGFFLRRPISICDINKDKGTIRLVCEVRGHGTDKIRATLLTLSHRWVTASRCLKRAKKLSVSAAA